MKPQTVNPSKQSMHFFTPELYIRFNSNDEGEANQADEDWENAAFAYRQHLEGLRDQMPSQVSKLAALCLHDAELMSFDEVVEPGFSSPFSPFPFWSAMTFLSVRHGEKIVSLIYFLRDRVREIPPQPGWPFSKIRTHWLYDEVDAAASHSGMFVHRILLSDGRVLEIPFMSVVTHEVTLTSPSPNTMSRQSA